MARNKCDVNKNRNMYEILSNSKQTETPIPNDKSKKKINKKKLVKIGGYWKDTDFICQKCDRVFKNKGGLFSHLRACLKPGKSKSFFGEFDTIKDYDESNKILPLSQPLTLIGKENLHSR